MTNIRMLPLTLAMLMLGLVSRTSAQSAPDSTKISVEWKNYDAPQFSMRYPSDWEVDKSGRLGTTLILLSPVESASDMFRENFNLGIQDMPAGKNIDLDKFTEISLQQIKTYIVKANILESKRIQIDGKPVQRVIYTGEQGALTLQFEQYYYVRDTKAYVLTFTGQQPTFGKFQSTGEKILNSFRLK